VYLDQFLQDHLGRSSYLVASRQELADGG